MIMEPHVKLVIILCAVLALIQQLTAVFHVMLDVLLVIHLDNVLVVLTENI